MSSGQAAALSQNGQTAMGKVVSTKNSTSGFNGGALLHHFAGEPLCLGRELTACGPELRDGDALAGAGGNTGERRETGERDDRPPAQA